MKIAIIGSGGVGGYFGGRMAKAGYDVTFVARGTHREAIQKNGLIVKSTFGDFRVKPAKTTDQINDIKEANLIISGVKAWQVKEIAQKLKPVIKPTTLVLPLQNGILAAEELMEELPEENVLNGLCRIFSKIESPGIIHHFGIDPDIVFGDNNNKKKNQLIEIKKIFDKSGIHSRISEDIQSDLWKKFIGICVSGLLAVTRSTYGQIREQSETRQLMIALLEEIYTLSQKAGVNIASNFTEKMVNAIDRFDSNSASSLARDVWEGNPSEIEYQNGTVVRLGGKLGVDVPINKFIYSCILPMEKRARNNYS